MNTHTNAATATHTPGPWTLEGGDSRLSSATGTDGAESWRLYSDNYHFGNYVDESLACGFDAHCPDANARLIAAAPDLLAAMQALFEHCAMVHKHWGSGCNTEEASAAIAAARAAIAKATA